ncbi:hypothetical protein R1flu_026728 [Riccia fluitans]|uniref:Uncharacterized protein n=1 Tax=Riccia fluitans TaxID=41844 RepID=A0ABD1XHA3_9MARC
MAIAGLLAGRVLRSASKSRGLISRFQQAVPLLTRLIEFKEKFRIDAPPRCFQENEDRKQETDETPQEKNGPADDHPTSNIPVVDLDKNTDGGADLHRVRDALLYAGFGVAMHTNKKDVKEEREAWTS